MVPPDLLLSQTLGNSLAPAKSWRGSRAACPPPLLGSCLWVWTWKGSSPGRSYGISTIARSLGCRRTGVLCFRNALRYEIGCIIARPEADVKRKFCNFDIAKIHINDGFATIVQNTAGKQSSCCKSLDKCFRACYDPSRQGKGVMSSDIPCLFRFFEEVSP